MNKMRIRVFLLMMVSMFCFTSIVVANKRNIRSNKDNEYVKEIDSLKAVVDTLQGELLRHDELQQDFLVSLDSCRLEKDSLQKEIEKKEIELNILRDERSAVNLCMLRLVNNWLTRKYNKEDIDKVIALLNKFYNVEELKEDRENFMQLLRVYEKSYNEFQSILINAQNDESRDDEFECDDYKTDYKNQIENLAYYKKYYRKDWAITYLDNCITEALELLDKHNYNKIVDFSSLIYD